MLEIGLATFNGASYLRQQLDSLFAQSFQDFVVVARDDGSVDDTLVILEQYARKLPGRLRILACSGTRLGASANFSRIAEQFSADYALFCDQDDVWMPEKIEKSLGKLRLAEACCAKGTPVLVHGDLKIVCAELRLLHPSFIHYTRLDPVSSSFQTLLVQSMVAGCTSIFNKALYQRALPVPPDAMMHDSWLALVACAFGSVHFLPEALILYRQHATNRCGARRPSWSEILAKASFALVDHPSGLLRYVRQAQAFLTRFEPELPPEKRSAAAAVAHIPRRTPVAAVRGLVRHRIARQGLLQNAALFGSTALLANSRHVPASAEIPDK